MEKQNLYRYYMFGWDYHILYGGHDFTVGDLQNNLSKFEEFIQENNLIVTSTIVNGDRTLENIKQEAKKLKSEDSVPEELSQRVKTFSGTIEKTLDAELKLRNAYILSEKRLGLEKLLNDVQGLFSQNVFDKLPPMAKKDFIEAGKCIAFEVPTASAFHILRATEETLRQYYILKVKKKDRIPTLLWGPMIIHLRNKHGIPKPLLDSYDNIRVNFRNPTLHPEMMYSLDESQDLFSVCIDAVSRIVRDMP